MVSDPTVSVKKAYHKIHVNSVIGEPKVWQKSKRGKIHCNKQLKGHLKGQIPKQNVKRDHKSFIFRGQPLVLYKLEY